MKNERGEKRPKINPVVDSLVNHIAHAGAFDIYRLYKGRERARAALAHYINPLIKAKAVSEVSIGFDSDATRDYPLGNIRVLAVVTPGEDVYKLTEELGESTCSDYPDLPLRFFQAVKDESGKINPEKFQEFSQGIESKTLTASDLKFGISQ